MRAFGKTVARTVKSNFARFLAITAIITIGVSFVSGLGALSPKVRSTFDNSLRTHNVADIIVKAQTADGLSKGTQADIAAAPCVADTVAFSMLEFDKGDTAERCYVLPAFDTTVNKPELLEGEFPTASGQCVVERSSDTIAETAIGDAVTITLTNEYPIIGKVEIPIELTVVGIVANPLFFCRDGDASIQFYTDPDDDTTGKPLDRILYTGQLKIPDTVNLPFPNLSRDLTLPVTDLYVRVKDAQNGSIFGAAYKQTVKNAVTDLQAITGSGENDPVYLTLDDNKSTAFLDGIAEKVDVITLFFPVFFILVTALVVLTTMSRLIEEERAAVGCYRSLGVSDGKIAFKYLLFAATCCLIGMAIGNVVGAYLLPAVVCPAFNIVFFLPKLVGAPRMTLGLISSAAMLVAVLGVTGYTVWRSLSEKPAALLKPKAPKAGKKIFLERIPFLWNRLSFKFKSMFRNVFRYVGRLLMVVISVAGSTALVFAGFGLRDVAATDSMRIGAMIVTGIGDSIKPIAHIIIIFAAALCILVIYNLTNMDIGERRREIATLKVLGYNNLEVNGYVYREIFLMTFFGICIGLPLGVGILAFIFHSLDFGALSDIGWYSYLLSAAVELVSVLCVDLLLSPKICRDDMNESLKAVE